MPETVRLPNKEDLKKGMKKGYKKMQKTMRKVGERMNNALATKFVQECCFVSSLVTLVVSTLILAAYPGYYWLFHNCLAILLFGIRLMYYKAKGWHYYLIEFCYFCTYYHIFLTGLAVVRWMGGPNSFLGMYQKHFMRSFFLLTNGPLAWSICLFRNSMVLHNLDQMTSLWLHMSPPLVAWTHRYRFKEIDAAFPGLFDFDLDPPSLGLEDYFRTALFYVVLWMAPYYVIMFKFVRRRIRVRGYDTLFHLLTEGKGVLAQPLSRFRMRTRTKVYTLMHFCGMLVGSAVAFIWWQHELLHTAFLFTMLVFSMWNGATYYFSVFVRSQNKIIAAKNARKAAEEKESEDSSTPAFEVEGRQMSRSGSTEEMIDRSVLYSPTMWVDDASASAEPVELPPLPSQPGGVSKKVD